ncbi:hypothetical protein Mgra_00005442 [Meloidogyne graminicola]|uniref:Uncharacterized protein n=1 Tax=Meloidogyne graminicola TaxID=189291 RepID=A0A8S9ZP12_9BILA|nr:hypothetical protein Mgra_00005442 [Meloidogyne graminicola]
MNEKLESLEVQNNFQPFF